ncbi:MAG: hypothetical protein J6K32_07080 [Clostridia bacterium]|nr:hypothetical protein [Clostridia bacterium]
MMNSRPNNKNSAQRGPFRGLRRALSRLMDSRVFLAVLSAVAAVLIWGALAASDGALYREKVFPSVAVSVTGESVLRSRGYVVMDDISELLPGVRLTVDLAQANYDRTNPTAFNPHIDLTEITGEGENTLPISYLTTTYGTVTKCEPESVTLNVERYRTKRVPVYIQKSGELAEGLYVKSTSADPNSLSVSGPKSLVDQVFRAVAVLDLTTLSADRMDDVLSLNITLQNARGDVIESDKLQIANESSSVITDSIIASVALLPMRSIPLELDAFVAGEPAEGYELEGVYAETTAFDIAADPAVLEGLTILTTDVPLSIDGASEPVNGYVRVRKPTGIENVVPADVAVTARIVEKTMERTFRSVPLAAEGVGADQRVSVMKENMRVQLSGGYGFINGLSKEDIRLFVDVSGLAPGTYTLPVQIHIDNAQPFACALGSPEVEVRIREKEVK